MLLGVRVSGYRDARWKFGEDERRVRVTLGVNRCETSQRDSNTFISDLSVG